MADSWNNEASASKSLNNRAKWGQLVLRSIHELNIVEASAKFWVNSPIFIWKNPSLSCPLSKAMSWSDGFELSQAIVRACAAHPRLTGVNLQQNHLKGEGQKACEKWDNHRKVGETFQCFFPVAFLDL